MKIHAFLLSLFVCFIGISAVSAQTEAARSADTLQNISVETSKISNTLDLLNQRLKSFSETFSSNQGLKFTNRQQKMLIAFEFLNRAETRLATLQQLKIQLTERLTTNRRKIAQINDDLRPESVDRSLSFRGTTDAEQLRTMRRQTLTNERNELNLLVNDIQNTLGDTNNEIRETESFLKNVRQRLFPEITKELADL